MRNTRSVPAAVLALLVTAACESSDVPVAPEPGDALASREASQAPFHTPDDEFARVSRAEVPGFAGFYLQNDGTPVVRLVDQSQRGAAQRYLAQHFALARRGRHAGAPTQPVFLGAAYDFAQLKAWSEALHPLLSRDGVYLIDVDEVGNRVLLGVAGATATSAVRAEAARLGIPAAAVHVQTQPRPEPRATVRDRFTTTVGGIQIAFSQYLCTLGFNAKRVSTGANIYVTNSHCTGTQNAYDGIAIYQNTVASGNQIGNEVADRGLYACAGTGTSCRRADAAYISNNGTRTVGQGGIARTAWATGGPGGLTVTGEYDIVGRYTGTLPVGTYLDKTGRTSGSTYGQVTNSCVTIGSLRCQDISKVWSEGGDSGSPVFVYLGGSGSAENDIQLHGVMWGGPGTDYTTTYSSRLSGIEQDLGTLSTLCRPGYGC
ncbi:MAG TPA: hypothetical protein VHG28_20025 [Longimicrobiaceae bacterium]|nr:hypothetical protein [Longimicrobiaceae bacterium]